MNLQILQKDECIPIKTVLLSDSMKLSATNIYDNFLVLKKEIEILKGRVLQETVEKYKENENIHTGYGSLAYNELVDVPIFKEKRCKHKYRSCLASDCKYCPECGEKL